MLLASLMKLQILSTVDRIMVLLRYAFLKRAMITFEVSNIKFNQIDFLFPFPIHLDLGSSVFKWNQSKRGWRIFRPFGWHYVHWFKKRCTIFDIKFKRSNDKIMGYANVFAEWKYKSVIIKTTYTILQSLGLSMGYGAKRM